MAFLCPLYIILKRNGLFMYPEVLRLVSLGFPLEDALTLFYSLSREGKLFEFITEQESLYRDRNGFMKEVV